MPFSKTFTYDGLIVRVECPDQAHLTWLEEFLIPAFSPGDDERVDCTVALEIDDSRHASLLRSGKDPNGHGVRGFVLDRGPVDLEAWTASGRERIFFDGDAEVFYRFDGDTAHIRILSTSRYLSRRLALMRVVRELAMSDSWTRTRFVLHAAALEYADTGVIIAGPKGAGKTTLLMHALAANRTRFIANDRVVVGLAEAPAVAHGMPTVVTVEEQTLDSFPAFAERRASSGYDERLALHEAGAHRDNQATNLTPAQFCALLQVPMSGSASARVVLFPRLTADTDGLRVQELSPGVAVQRLGASIFAAGAPQISEGFALPGHSCPPASAIVRELSRALISQVRCFECALGRPARHTTDAVRDFVSTLSASA